MDASKIEELNIETIKNNKEFEEKVMFLYKMSILASFSTFGIASMINYELANHVATIGKAPIDAVATVGAAGLAATVGLVVGVPAVVAAVGITAGMVKLGGSAVKIICDSLTSDKQAVANLTLESRMTAFRQNNPDKQATETNSLEVSKGLAP